ncbi:LuxR C-terminal-related transcriptional regulator [Micromonospora sp. NPDC047548]|uniref:LuxR C-terminal-related transcriptional regulator n=1 Tax=Micromonospora sp. NPDC047548 TaxID=3155624 RepID=UPI0033CE10CE
MSTQLVQVAAGTTPAAPAPERLTDGERRMLAMLAAGLSREQIGRHTGCVPTTVGRQLTRIYRRIGAINAANAVAIAIRDGLINARPNQPGASQ